MRVSDPLENLHLQHLKFLGLAIALLPGLFFGVDFLVLGFLLHLHFTDHILFLFDLRGLSENVDFVTPCLGLLKVAALIAVNFLFIQLLFLLDQLRISIGLLLKLLHLGLSLDSFLLDFVNLFSHLQLLLRQQSLPLLLRLLSG